MYSTIGCSHPALCCCNTLVIAFARASPISYSRGYSLLYFHNILYTSYHHIRHHLHLLSWRSQALIGVLRCPLLERAYNRFDFGVFVEDFCSRVSYPANSSPISPWLFLRVWPLNPRHTPRASARILFLSPFPPAPVLSVLLNTFKSQSLTPVDGGPFPSSIISYTMTS